jgi:hypothetical protein
MPAITLFASFGGPSLDDLIALTVGAEHGNEHHHDLLDEKASV